MDKKYETYYMPLVTSDDEILCTTYDVNEFAKVWNKAVQSHRLNKLHVIVHRYPGEDRSLDIWYNLLTTD